jgi:hypothetical protein
MRRSASVIAIALCGWVSAFSAQDSSQPRRILFDTFQPIAARILPGDQRIVVVSGQPAPGFALPEADVFVTAIVQENPIIVTGRIIEKQPVFMRLLAGQPYLEVPAVEANWIGSRVTVTVDRIIQTVAEMALMTLQRLTFVEAGDGAVTIRGVRIETETPWLAPLQLGRRYLITGKMNGGVFSTTGMWMDPPDGGSLHPRFKDRSAPFTPAGTPASGTPGTPFDAWTIDEAIRSLESEVRRQPPGR